MALLSPRALAAALAFGFGLPPGVSAQVKASETGSVSQTVDGTRITLEYYRPRARGRDSLFGKVVKWGEVWTPGANWATTLDVSKNVRLEGHGIPKGKYSVWMVVRPASDWTLVLDPKSHRFHEEHPDSTPEQIRFPIRVQQRPFAEVLTWSFPDVRVSGATLALQWGTTYVSLELEVEPTYRIVLAAEKADPYLGTYEYLWRTPGDTAKPVGFFVSYQNGSLMGRWDPVPYPEWARFVLIRIADDWFIPGFLDEKGAVYEVAREMVFEFKVVSGRAGSFEVRGDDDSVMATGKRKG